MDGFNKKGYDLCLHSPKTVSPRSITNNVLVYVSQTGTNNHMMDKQDNA